MGSNEPRLHVIGSLPTGPGKPDVPPGMLSYGAPVGRIRSVWWFGLSHRFLSTAALVSAILLSVVALMWLGSLFSIDRWAWGTKAAEYQIISRGGGIYIARIVNWHDKPFSLEFTSDDLCGWDARGDESIFYLLWKARPHWFAFVRGSLRDDGLQPCWLIVMPYWSLAVVSGVLPLWWGLCFARTRRITG